MSAKSTTEIEPDAAASPQELPTVSIILPVFNEEAQLERCLSSIADQSYPAIIEVVVADGGSTDGTRSVSSKFAKVHVVDNPRRIRPAGLNTAIAAASGDIIVRVDARTALAPDYVECCVSALERSGAAIVGGQMRYEAHDARQRGIVAAMTSRLGAGPAAFRREGGEPRYVDTVYLGAFRASTIREMGCYDEWSGGNEDAELAWRAQSFGGVYLDPSIKSYYLGRDGLRPLARQFYRYGHNRARTIHKHPGSLSWRQLAVPALFVGLASPWRRSVLAAYVMVILGRGAVALTRDPPAVPTLLAALPTMHAAWGWGFVRGIVRRGLPGLTNGHTSCASSGGSQSRTHLHVTPIYGSSMNLMRRWYPDVGRQRNGRTSPSPRRGTRRRYPE
jgi:glycosyltransferase involved in cell wall biosynthesis